METTQTSRPLSSRTRDDARAALARAFEEAAVMPGTLLPHEILTELTEVARSIAREVTTHEAETVVTNGLAPWAYIIEHSISATVMGLRIGRRLLPHESLEDLSTGLFLQDIGMLALPPSVVQKPGPLEPDEWTLLMQHPFLGLEFLRDDTISAAAKSVVSCHHERWDGGGYPTGLAGEQTPAFARIAAVADSFAAMTSERYHARALPPDVAADIIRSGAGGDFDPDVVGAFDAVVRD